MTEKYTPETKIRLLLALINDKGYEKFQSEFSKLLLRLNEFYESNTNDIIKYLSLSICHIPLKGKIYAKVIKTFNKQNITEETFKKVVNILSTTNDPFVHLRTFIFLIESVAIDLISKTTFINFLEAEQDSNLIWMFIFGLLTVYKGEEFILEAFEKIKQKSNLRHYELFLKLSDEIQKEELYNQVPHLNVDLPEVESDSASITLDYNPFEEISKISYSLIIYPNLLKEISSKIIDQITQHEIIKVIYKVILYDIIIGLKDNYQICQMYIFNMSKFYNISNEIQGKFFSFLPEAILQVSMHHTNSLAVVNLISSLSLVLIKHSPNLESEFTTYLTEYISKSNLDALSPYEIYNMISFITFYTTNIVNSKSTLLKIKIDPSASNNNYFYIKCLCDKMSNLITKENFEQITKEYDSITDLISMHPNGSKLSPSPDTEILNQNIKLKQSFNEFRDKLTQENSNDLLYNFASSILINRSKTLSHLREGFTFYADSIRELTNENKDEKEYILLNSIFDVWGHSSVHLIFIIELLYNKYLLGHMNVIKYIFNEKLNQSKEHVLNWVYYEIINLTINNSKYLINKAKNDLVEQQENLVKTDEDKRQNVVKKIEFFEEIVERMKKEKELLIGDIMGKFEQLHSVSERLGGELKDFLKSLINDFIDCIAYKNQIDVQTGLKIKQKLE